LLVPPLEGVRVARFVAYRCPMASRAALHFALTAALAVLCSLVVVATAAAASATVTLHGRVVSIADGDTLTVLDADKRQHIIRLDGIDAPEKAQPFGNVSKRHLSDLAFGREAMAECHKVDRYGRNVCRVIVDGADVCLAQVQAGFAWHFKRYETEQREEHRRAYATAEDEARDARVGLWSAPGALPPWKWRGGMRMREQEAQAVTGR
jgi:endonuclease YncB( thermonuclease family)